MKLLHNGKHASNEIPHFSHSVYKTQCAEKQLVDYSAQSNVLAAPLKCRQHHVQREHQCQTQFSATFENQGSGTIYNTKYMLAIGKENAMRRNAAY